MRHVVPVYSIAKSYTAIAALRSLDIDLPVGHFIADLRADLAALTCRELLTHRSGLNDYSGWADYRAAVEARVTPWPVQDILERAEVGSPGNFRYSNIGYLLVLQALEQTHAASFFDVLQERVFTPLNVAARPFATLADWDSCTHPAAVDHVRTYHPGWVYSGTFAADPQEAARGLALVMQGALGEAIPLVLRESHRVGVPAAHPMSPGAGYGLGVMTSGEPTDVIGHGGQGPGFDLFAATTAAGTRWYGEAQATEREGTEDDLIRRCLEAIRRKASRNAE